MPMPNDTAKHDSSFIVRIWWEHSESDAQTGHWRGWIQHVRNGKQIYFASLADLNAFIEAETGMHPANDTVPPGLG